MFDLSLTAEQIEFRDTVRDFVQNEVKAAALHPSRLEPFEKPLLDELLDYASRMGLRTLSLSEAKGGAGADTLTACIVLEELAAGDVDLAAALNTTQALARALFDDAANEETKRLLPQFLEDARYHLALARADANAERGWHYHGTSDVQAPASAVKKGSEWVLDGAFEFVANAPIAKLIIVQAKTDSGGIGTFAVPRNATGLNVGAAPAAFGGTGGTLTRWHHGTGASVRLEKCRVGAGNVLATEPFATAYEARTQAQIAAINLGLGRAAYEAAVDYAKIRVQGGRHIIEHQSIGGILADAAIKLELARNMIWKAAWAADRRDAEQATTDLPLSTVARVYTAEAMHEVTLGAAECFGAMGVMRDMPLQKYVHDAFVFLNGEGHDSATKLEIAEVVAGYERVPA